MLPVSGAEQLNNSGAGLALRQEEIPETFLARFRLQLLDDGIDLPGAKLFRLAVVPLLVRIDVAIHERADAVLEFGNLLALLIEHMYSSYFFFVPGSVPIILHNTISITSSAPPPIEVRRLSRYARLTGVSFMN